MSYRIAQSLFSKRAMMPSYYAAITLAAASVSGGVVAMTTTSNDNQPRRRGRGVLVGVVTDFQCRSSCESSPAVATGSASFLGRHFVADAVEKVLPSVVRVEVQVKPSDGPTGANYNQRGSGSGFLVHAKDVFPSRLQQQICHCDDNDVLVITNAHCVLTPDEFRQSLHDEESKLVYLELPDGQSVTGTILVFDTDRDVALIQPLGLKGEVKAAKLHLQRGKQAGTCSPSVRYGEFIAAIGAPLELESTVTVGIVSNPCRSCLHSQGMVYIQTDNTCHVGNSGGPLINMDGQVIGITAKKVADGISYSIPIDVAVQALRNKMGLRNSSQLGPAIARAHAVANAVDEIPHPLPFLRKNIPVPVSARQ